MYFLEGSLSYSTVLLFRGAIDQRRRRTIMYILELMAAGISHPGRPCLPDQGPNDRDNDGSGQGNNKRLLCRRIPIVLSARRTPNPMLIERNAVA